MVRPVAICAVLSALWVCSSCDVDDAEQQGDLGQDCYPSMTCNVGLMCSGGVCTNSGPEEGRSVGVTSDALESSDLGWPEGNESASPDAGPDQSSTQTPQPAALKPYDGVCPTFTSGAMTFSSAGRDRQLTVTLPEDPTNAPVVFIYHGNGDNSANISSAFRAQTAAEQLGAIVVAPQSCCGMMSWPFIDVTPETYPQVPFPVNEDPTPDLSLFDDVLSCLDEAYGIDRHRVYTTGFSAGGLWSTYLVLHRSAYLAAAAVFSGGVGIAVQPSTPEFDTPVLVGHGGQMDTFNLMILQVYFEEHAEAFMSLLEDNGHFAVHCNHGLGHNLPFNAPNWIYSFLFAHEFGDEGSIFSDPMQRGAFPDYCVWPQ